MNVDTARGSFEVVDGSSGAPLVLVHAFPLTAFRAALRTFAGRLGRPT